MPARGRLELLMPEREHFAAAAASVGIDEQKLAALLDRAEKEVREGLLPSAQVAIARHGVLAAMRSFGRVAHGDRAAAATNETLYAVFSTTKAITSSAVWLLFEAGLLDPAQAVAEIVPEFASNGKDAVRVEHLLTHTAGFPYAPFQPSDWLDIDKRLARFRQWRLDWPPGSRFEYHPVASMWVLAHLIEVRAGQPFHDFVRTRIAEPLGLSDLRLGCPPAQQHRVADIVYVGDEASEAEMAAMGMSGVVESEAVREGYLGLNRAEVRSIPVPGGGGFMTAGDLALFYQALLAGGRAADGTRIWRSETIRDALQVRTGDLTEPWFNKKALRCLGLVIAGDGDRVFRGFAPSSSPRAFGHNGAGGQIAWADPETGVSFAYCTNGFDRNPIRQASRGVALSERAARCAY